MRPASLVLRWLLLLLVMIASGRLFSGNVTHAVKAGVSRTERGALKVLFWATQGPGWQRKWDIQNEMSDPCLDSWYGIVCDQNGHIKSIRLASNNLVGSIPPEFARPGLRFLKELDVSSNFLTGPLPATLSHLKRLLVLRVNANWFIGRVPESLSQLTLLEHLEVQGNQFDTAFDGAILPPAVKALGRNGRCHLIDQ